MKQGLVSMQHLQGGGGGHSTGQWPVERRSTCRLVVICGSMKLAKCQRMAMSRYSGRRVNIIREGYSNKAMYYFEE